MLIEGPSMTLAGDEGLGPSLLELACFLESSGKIMLAEYRSTRSCKD